jgi:hypothetical protein
MTFELRRCAYPAIVGLAWIVLLLLVALHAQPWVLRVPSGPARTLAVMKLPPGQTILGAVDGALDSRQPDGTGQIVVPAHSFIVLHGWVTSTVAGRSITQVTLILDNRLVRRQTHFYRRDDVAAAFARPDFAISGWEMNAKLDDIHPGPHSGRVDAADSEGRAITLLRLQLSVLP